MRGDGACQVEHDVDVLRDIREALAEIQRQQALVGDEGVVDMECLIGPDRVLPIQGNVGGDGRLTRRPFGLVYRDFHLRRLRVDFEYFYF